MKAERVKNAGEYRNHGGGFFASGRNRSCESKKTSKHPRWQRKTEGESKKGLANRWNRKRITKKVHAGRGLETIWEMSDKRCFKFKTSKTSKKGG
jgi:hypothetical protein